MTSAKTAIWMSPLLALAVTGLLQRASAQQAVPIPQLNFHSAEDTWKTGVKPGDIRPGVRPDYNELLNELLVVPVQGDIYVIAGAGANIVVLANQDGVLLVDSGVPDTADKVIAAYKKLSPKPVRWVINTSADLDHTGGNEPVSKSGSGGFNPVGPGNPNGQALPVAAGTGDTAGIRAYATVLNRMSARQSAAPRPPDAWPTDVFSSPERKMWFAGEPMELHYQPAAHTDGDVIVFFRKADVIAAGDILTNDRYPVIDADKGGSIQGIIDGLNHLVDIAIPQFNQMGGTRIVPGHGRICNQSDVVEYRDAVTIIRDRMKAMVQKGMTLEQIKAARPTLDYDGVYGSTTGRWTTDMFLNEVYKELSRAAAAAPAAKKPAVKSSKS